MAVESAEDLEGFFDPDEFGEPMVARITAGDVQFHGIFTSSPSSEQPGTFADINGVTPRIIARRLPLVDLKQDDEIVRADDTVVKVNNTQIKGELLIIHVHEVW